MSAAEGSPLLGDATTVRYGRRYQRVGEDTDALAGGADADLDFTGLCSRRRFYAMVGVFFGLATIALILTMSLKHHAGPGS